jgi:hypothetical protein
LHSEALGLDYAGAVKCAEEILMPAFDAWRGGDTKTAAAPATAAIGTLDWVFAEYRSDRRYTKRDGKTKRNHENGFKLVGSHVLKDDRRLDQARVTAITTPSPTRSMRSYLSSPTPKATRSASVAPRSTMR